MCQERTVAFGAVLLDIVKGTSASRSPDKIVKMQITVLHAPEYGFRRLQVRPGNLHFNKLSEVFINLTYRETTAPRGTWTVQRKLG